MAQTDKTDEAPAATDEVVVIPSAEKGRVRKRPMTYNLPKNVTEEGDGRFRIVFPKEITVSGVKTDHVIMRLCLVRDRIAAREVLDDPEDGEALTYMIMANLCDAGPDAWDDVPFKMFKVLTDGYRAIHEGKDPRPSWCAGNTDDGFEIDLRYGLDVDGATTKRLRMKPITVGIRKNASKLRSDIQQEIRMISLMCGIEDEQVKSLHIWDYQRLLECLGDFLDLGA